MSSFFKDELISVLQNGNGVESDYQKFKKIQGASDIAVSSPMLPTNPKIATSSYMNEYAFISYGGHYLTGGSPSNTFKGPDSIVAQNGLISSHEQWKNPTAKNIIEWSKQLLERQKKLQATNPPTINESAGISGIAAGEDEIIQQTENNVKGVSNIDNSSRLNLPPTLGALKYEWKDFAFCKHFGSIPNNRLVTLRRFKLPTLDSGAVIGRNELVEKVKNWGYDSSDYLNTDSARALTYFGDGTGNTINSFVGFNFNLAWDERENSIDDIPTVNAGISGYNPFLKKDVQSLVLGEKLSSALENNVYASAAGFMLQSGNANGSSGDINTTDTSAQRGDQVQNAKGKKSPRDIALENAPSMSPWETGWQNRIYGPINVITRTYRRDRGLNFTSDIITLTFEYDVMQVDTLNHKLAMLDIISNILALTYADATFYGGDYRFLREPTDIPIPYDLRKAIEDYATGDETNFATLGEKYGEFALGNLQKILSSIDDAKNQVMENDKARNALEKVLQSIGFVVPKESTNETSPKESTNEKQPKNTTDGEIRNQLHIMDTIGNKASDIVNSISELIGAVIATPDSASGTNPLKYVVSAIMGKAYSINSIVEKMTTITPMFTGEPVGEWHLTVGNPMNPFMMIGNLICTNCKIEFNDTLGPDDFPTQLKAEITLRHARERDKGDIESMFNLGQGRFYVNVPGAPEPWNTGFSSNDTANDTAQLNDIQKARLAKEKSFSESLKPGQQKTYGPEPKPEGYSESDQKANEAITQNLLDLEKQIYDESDSFKIPEFPSFNV